MKEHGQHISKHEAVSSDDISTDSDVSNKIRSKVTQKSKNLGESASVVTNMDVQGDTTMKLLSMESPSQEGRKHDQNEMSDKCAQHKHRPSSKVTEKMKDGDMTAPVATNMDVEVDKTMKSGHNGFTVSGRKES